jgi:hypothetical protein
MMSERDISREPGGMMVLDGLHVAMSNDAMGFSPFPGHRGLESRRCSALGSAFLEEEDNDTIVKI